MRRWRVYFNRELDWPQVWSVDEGDQSTEINVIAVHLMGCTVQSVFDPTAPAPNAPKAWFDVFADHFELRNGTLTFY